MDNARICRLEDIFLPENQEVLKEEFEYRNKRWQKQMSFNKWKESYYKGYINERESYKQLCQQLPSFKVEWLDPDHDYLVHKTTAGASADFKISDSKGIEIYIDAKVTYKPDEIRVYGDTEEIVYYKLHGCAMVVGIYNGTLTMGFVKDGIMKKNWQGVPYLSIPTKPCA